ncbi:STN domain-containing protein [Chitinophaga caseinilytica]|uniref:Carboxypeptidase-like regulatory domain-containing protein n=1 Tax=Chitinophaga caseinilytica TaxID=2267521 RepID=A0ABZ2YYZ5_9BACT
MQVSASSYSQQITLSGRNMRLKQIFREINRQTSMQFFVEDELLKDAGRIDVDIRDKPLDVALKSCLEGLQLDYAIVDRTIVITKAVPRAAAPGPVPEMTVITLKGTVTDEHGMPLPGATVKLKGTAKGVATDALGRFTLEVPEKGAVLVVSYIGYEPQDVAVTGSGPVLVALKPVEGKVEEVVIVAHGRQKKSEVVGAVTTIKPSELKIPVSNLTNALAGRLAGVIAFQRSGEPGFDNADFFVRGVTTFGYRKSPLSSSIISNPPPPTWRGCR